MKRQHSKAPLYRCPAVRLQRHPGWVLRTLICLWFTLPVVAAPPWKLVWNDEFNGPAHARPDKNKWTYDLGGGGWGNNELEIYTRRRENASLDGDGHLVIRAVKHPPAHYTSARLKTQGKFTVRYGRVAVRMKLPYGQGVWPAFWMLGSDIDRVGWPDCGEIDVMENIGREPSLLHGTIHGPGYSGGGAIGRSASLAGDTPLANDFHVYAAEWARGSITFLLDDKPYFTVTPNDLKAGTRWVYDHPFFLLLNFAVGGNWPGNPDGNTHFPQSMTVDWVRVWQRSE
jgi:beta-glucanase (GH16 family)